MRIVVEENRAIDRTKLKDAEKKLQGERDFRMQLQQQVERLRGLSAEPLAESDYTDKTKEQLIKHMKELQSQNQAQKLQTDLLKKQLLEVCRGLKLAERLQD